MSMLVTAVKGDGLAMGRTMGEAFSPHIHSAVRFYETLSMRHGGLEKILSNLGPYIDAATTYAPELAAEVEGMAEGADLDRDIAWFFNAMEETWSFEACTSIVATDAFSAATVPSDRAPSRSGIRDGFHPRARPRWLMHAEQWYAGHDEIGVVIAQPDDAPAFVSPTCSGFLPAVGMNAAGIAQGVDSLEATDERVGVPRLLVSRSVLGATGIGHAIQLADHPQRAGGYAYMLATSERATALELTATTHAVLPDERAHTNHALDPAVAALASESSEGSVVRLERARDLLRESPPKSLEDCIEIMSDHVGHPQRICLHDDTGYSESGGTVFGMVCDLETGVVAVSEGRPCSSEWHEFQVPNFKTAGAARVV